MPSPQRHAFTIKAQHASVNSTVKAFFKRCYTRRMAQLTPQDDYLKTALRLPRELHSRIQEAAAKSGRSMNAELIHRLESSFQPTTIDESAVADRLLIMLRRAAQLEMEFERQQMDLDLDSE
ncbi:Arc family DNA-binding protein [Chitiniphilus eburneus]|uniref:Arc family DNA-binding protein n=1 Tax=Chitiniphilus eburneus TaxID=2571148 RepID=A0A4U0PND6_9NEIS|nr:Arc family DNA-binding protein [Chitiniphilus eburneus]TJZ69753.1 Arc family DNA-binding protein [Chitiniphilus eburneus]